jgi:hypothetical protein
MSKAASAGTYLFAPQLTYRIRHAGGAGSGISDEGTPIQLDEPQAPNPPTGLVIDYQLAGAASTPVVLEIADANGHTIRTYSSSDHPKSRDPQTAQIAPWWIHREAVPSADPGAHRFVWDFNAKSASGPIVPPGDYTVRLRVNGKTYTQRATILRDPRIPASVADLRAQYDFSNAIEKRLAEIDAARTRAESAKLSHAQRDALLGVEPASNPDDSVGKPAQDFTTLRYIGDALGNLEGAVEGGDTAPSPDMRAAYKKLSAMLDATLAKLRAAH